MLSLWGLNLPSLKCAFSPGFPTKANLDARGLFFHGEAAIVSGEAVIEILAIEDLDRGFATHNCSFATKTKPSGIQGRPRHKLNVMHYIGGYFGKNILGHAKIIMLRLNLLVGTYFTH